MGTGTPYASCRNDRSSLLQNTFWLFGTELICKCLVNIYSVRRLLCAGFVCLSFLTFSCSDGENGHIIKARLNKTAIMELDSDAVRSASFHSDGVPVGNIMYGKSYGDILFLFDESRYCLYQVTGSTIVTALDKVGRGPGEYVDIGAFTYLPETREIVIFERATKTLLFYRDGSLTRQIPLDFYVNAMEAFSSDHILFARESDYPGGPAAILDYTLSTGDEKQLLSLREDQVELLPDWAFCNHNVLIYFGITGLTTDIYSYRDDIRKVASVSFSPDVLGKQYWTGEFDDRKEDMLLEALQGGYGGAAVGPCLLQVSDERIAFWYMTGTAIYYHNLPDQALCVIEDGCVDLFRQVLDPRDAKTVFQPIAVWGDSFVTVDDADEFTLTEFSLKYNELQDDSAVPSAKGKRSSKKRKVDPVGNIVQIPEKVPAFVGGDFKEFSFADTLAEYGRGLLFYFGNDECQSCLVEKLPVWTAELSETFPDVPIIYVLASDMALTNLPSCSESSPSASFVMDLRDRFLKWNAFVPKKSSQRVYALDSKGKILLSGNPVGYEALKEQYMAVFQ